MSVEEKLGFFMIISWESARWLLWSQAQCWWCGKKDDLLPWNMLGYQSGISSTIQRFIYLGYGVSGVGTPKKAHSGSHPSLLEWTSKRSDGTYLFTWEINVQPTSVPIVHFTYLLLPLQVELLRSNRPTFYDVPDTGAESFRNLFEKDEIY